MHGEGQAIALQAWSVVSPAKFSKQRATQNSFKLHSESDHALLLDSHLDIKNLS